MSTITIVSTWYGPDTAGGAETQARQLAQAIHALGVPVEVWATNGRDAFSPAEPYYPTGPAMLDGIPLRRFAITPPQSDPYLPRAIANQAALVHSWQGFPTHEQRLLASLPSSDELLLALTHERAGRRFVFVLYAFPLSFWGVALLGEHASLLPCLHDEPYAAYSSYGWMFRQAGVVLCNSPAEARLARRNYDLPEGRVVVAGEGIDLTPIGDGAAFRARHGLQGAVLRYAGRRDQQKNMPLLLAYLREYWARRGTRLTLVLSGRDPLELPAALREIVLDLGDVPAQERVDAYAAADLFVHASTYESFSIVLMESWLQGVPALVNAHCDVTREAAEASGGGVAFSNFGEFASALDLLLADGALRRKLGARGQAWVREHCRWDAVARRTVAALGGV